jgi:hypothetical protein
VESDAVYSITGHIQASQADDLPGDPKFGYFVIECLANTFDLPTICSQTTTIVQNDGEIFGINITIDATNIHFWGTIIIQSVPTKWLADITIRRIVYVS